MQFLRTFSCLALYVFMSTDSGGEQIYGYDVLTLILCLSHCGSGILEPKIKKCVGTARVSTRTQEGAARGKCACAVTL